jgi:FkbM family methyltransferase
MMTETHSIDQYELEYNGEYFKIFVPDYWVKIYRGQKKEPLYPDYRLMLDLLKKSSKERYVLDIGANHGLFAIPAAKMGYKVFGFEPVAVNIETLIMAKEANGLKSFDMFHLALSNVNEQIEIYVPECPDNSSLSQKAAVSNMRGKDFHVENVEAKRFDDWIESNQKYKDIGFIKMDVQGAEYIILEGMTKYLSTHNDIYLICEYEHHLNNMGHTFEELDILIQALGFNFVGYLSPNDKIHYKP